MIVLKKTVCVPANAVSQIFVTGKKNPQKKLINQPISGFILSRKKTDKKRLSLPLWVLRVGPLFFHSKKRRRKKLLALSGCSGKTGYQLYSLSVAEEKLCTT